MTTVQCGSECESVRTCVHVEVRICAFVYKHLCVQFWKLPANARQMATQLLTA